MLEWSKPPPQAVCETPVLFVEKYLVTLRQENMTFSGLSHFGQRFLKSFSCITVITHIQFMSTRYAHSAPELLPPPSLANVQCVSVVLFVWTLTCYLWSFKLDHVYFKSCGNWPLQFCSNFVSSFVFQKRTSNTLYTSTRDNFWVQTPPTPYPFF